MMFVKSGIFVCLLVCVIADVTQNYSKPDYATSTTITWAIDKTNYLGIELHPGDQFIFDVPKQYQAGIVRNVILSHRKDSKYDASVTYNPDGTFWDSQGAYDTITCRNIKNKYEEGWIAKKFAEPRDPSNPEVENLHDWVEYVGIFSTDRITLTNVSPLTQDLAVANVHEVAIEFFPSGKIASSQIEVYTPGTTFVDLAKNILEPNYGGGPNAGLSDTELSEYGLYPYSAEIGSYGNAHQYSNTSYVDYYGALHIKIPKGKIVGGIDVSVGDSGYDKSLPPQDQINKDGGIGSLGWAKITATLSLSGEIMIYSGNAPPAGVLSGGPETTGYVSGAGEEIIVTSSSYAWVMGYKVVFMK